RKLLMVDPVGGVQQGFDGSGFLAAGSRYQADREQHHRNMFGQPANHHLALVVGLDIGAPEARIGGIRVGCSRGSCAAATASLPEAAGWSYKRVRRVWIVTGNLSSVIRAGGKGFVGVDGGDAQTAGKLNELGDCTGVGVRLINGARARG